MSSPNYCTLMIFVLFLAAACGILVPGLGIEPVPSAVEAQSLNPWTAREVLIFHKDYQGHIYIEVSNHLY